MNIYIKVDVCIYIYNDRGCAASMEGLRNQQRTQRGRYLLSLAGKGKGDPGKKKGKGGHSGASSIPWPLIRGPLPSPSPSRQVQLR